MNAEIQAAMKTAEVKSKLGESGIETAEGSVADFAAFMTTERQRLAALAAKAKMSAEH